LTPVRSDPRALVPMLLLVDSVHYVFARLLLPHLAPAPAGFFIMAVATAEVALMTRGRIRLDVLRRHWLFFLAIGCCIGTSTATSIAAMRYVDPGTASLLSRASVIFGLALGVLWLRERLAPIEWLGAAGAVTGVFVVSFQPGEYLAWGSLLVLVGTFLYALHAALVKRHGGQMAFLDFFLFRVAATAVYLLVVCLAEGSLVWPGPRGWALVVVTATVDTVVSRALYYLVLRRLDMSVHTLILTLSPVVTMGWSFALFDRLPGAQEILGGVAVLGGVLLVTASRTGWRPRAPG
jgi:drug/metabolite transporter (DMT)-like permease